MVQVSHNSSCEPLVCDFQTTFLKTRIKATEVSILATSAGHLKCWRYGKTRDVQKKKKRGGATSKKEKKKKGGQHRVLSTRTCDRSYVWPHDLKRHIKNKHNTQQQQHHNSLSAEQQQDNSLSSGQRQPSRITIDEASDVYLPRMPEKPAAMHIYHLTISGGKGKAYYHSILRRPSWSADVLRAVKRTSPKDYWKMQMVCLRYLLRRSCMPIRNINLYSTSWDKRSLTLSFTKDYPIEKNWKLYRKVWITWS
jgi:hypothetical protein